MKSLILKNRKGIILLSVVLFSLALIVIIITLMGWAVNEYSWTNRSFMTLRALNLADSGVELAAWEVMHNESQFTGWSAANLTKTLTVYSFQDGVGETIGDIAISADNTSPGHYLVTSTGYIPSIAKPTVKKTVKAKIFPHPLFNNGIFGDDTINISGTTTADSYDSSVGPYSSLTAGSDSDIGTNGTVTLSGSAMVEGDVIVGPDGTASGTDASHITGETFYSGNEVELEEITLPDYFTGLPNLGNLALSGKDAVSLPSGNYIYENITLEAKSTLTLASGTNIYINSSISISAQAALYTNGDVELYLGGNGTFAGKGIINSTGVPNDLQIYGLGDDAVLSFSGSSDFYGVVYAPESTLYLAGDADYFGAVVGEDVTLSGQIKFHYDESLSTDGPFSGYDIAYWQED